MPPKGKKTKAEEALDFLSNLDNLQGDASPADAASATSATAPTPAATGPTPRASTDSTRPKAKASLEDSRTGTPSNAVNEQDEEAQKALEFLEAQIKTKRAPLSAPRASTASATASRTATPAPAAAPAPAASDEASVPASGGWGSFWSTATSAIQSAQKIADDGYKRVRTEGVSGVAGTLGNLKLEEQLKGRGVNLDALRKGAEERLGGLQGYVKGVDLDKLRHDLLAQTSSTLTTIINTVAPPISAHETLELWLSHPLVGYSGVEGVVYRAWTSILEQTDSGELVIISSPEDNEHDRGERSINPVKGWEEAWKRQIAQVEAVKSREGENPKGRAQASPDVPVTTVPIFLHLQPVLAPLPFPEPQVLLSSSTLDAAKPDKEDTGKPNEHLYFIMTLHDPIHSLRFSTVSQPSPGDWLEVEYDRSDWVEERLVEVLRTGVEIIAQDYVATRMALKPSAVTRPASPSPESAEAAKQDTKTAESAKKE